MSWVITVKAPYANPKIDRSRSGLRIAGGSLLSPGSYEAKVGDSYEVTCVVTSDTEGRILTAVFLNGEEVQSWEDTISAGGSVSHTYTGTFDRPSSEVGAYEISIATYRWDPARSQYVKNDEYGC